MKSNRKNNKNKKINVKRTIAAALLTAFMLVVTGCGASMNGTGGGSEPDNGTVPTVSQQPESSPEENVSGTDSAAASGALVVYFSRTGEQYGVGVIDKGNTAIVADIIADMTGADTYEILPQKDYPYTYNELTDVAKQEQNDNARPAIAGEAPDLSQYDTIFIGAPVWWGDWPMIMYTFFEGNRQALAGKTLIPFSTHAGSGLSGFDKKLASACPDSAVGKGLAVAGSDAQSRQDKVKEDVSAWLAELGY